MLFSNIGIIDENFEYQAGKHVGVQGDRITYVGDAAPENPQDFGRRYDGTNRLLMPALYNAHAHAPMTLLRGFAENLPLSRWLNEKCWPFEAKITPEDIYWSTLLACAEMARYGVVGFTDMYYGTEERIAAVNKLNMKANLCEGLLALEPKPYSDYPVCAKNEELVAKYHGSSDGRIKVDYNIHAEYTSTPEVCQEIAAIAKEKGLRIHLHLSETQNEVAECKERHDGMTPPAYFESIGVLDVPVTAAHCVWMEEGDLDILQRHGVFVANCPVSNMKLGSGFAPIPAMLERGMNVCVGSDGMASNNNHNLFSDLYVMGLVYKGSTLDPAVVDPAQILRAATRTGALSQGREDCGLVKEGFKADLCVLDTAGPQWAPLTAPLYNVVFAGEGSDVVLTMSDGAVAYEQGEWPGLDLEEVKREVAARTKRIIESL
ncbi:amidohydrolase [Xiamenia xianingshaonis]|uniref:Amidohydrolase family protein n=1 Tax=Xiamenia xianingshaonis TaxID=2682776 RepID=A0ABX0IG34_9ACTN|nr:amidohydrolase [Xiamenia xianingshaonis]NHM13568.1 amidohydrolase family protein [Xiamenia xianingshaonis]